MSEIHFLVRSLNGKPSFSVEYYPERKRENNIAPITRFKLTPIESRLSMNDLIKAYAAGTLTKWETPPAKPVEIIPKGMKQEL